MSVLIDMLHKEHEEIIKFTAKLRQMSLDLMVNNTFDVDEFRACVEFIKTYADIRHHQKEEDILFKSMIEHLGVKAENLIRHGMLVEHDLARFQVKELEKAIEKYNESRADVDRLDVISLAMGYCYLLERHADKENKVVYPFGVKNLSPEIMEALDKEAIEYEKKFR